MLIQQQQHKQAISKIQNKQAQLNNTKPKLTATTPTRHFSNNVSHSQKIGQAVFCESLLAKDAKDCFSNNLFVCCFLWKFDRCFWGVLLPVDSLLWNIVCVVAEGFMIFFVLFDVL